eukprot:CAMPEP_0114511848 /NCGR_PEP_ID=MMETSP0109-20121206/14635_1 /TAXON_ID=29199 /ORGANISM="Chlorarachnion reptans, Strain CCCM449" /LENGTH=1201 /DNA_ID=CAMNT_0001691441 /DNA_START=230 /DNA_END=3835 /DNA_ORIENTATION=+
MEESHKAHRSPASGPKARKKKARSLKKRNVEPSKRQNPKAYTFASVVRAKRSQQRNQDRAHRKEHAPMSLRLGAEPPPFFVAVVGPKGVGKSLLIKCLVRHYTKQNLLKTTGPITIISGKKRRVTLFECPTEINAMCDVAKVADLVLLVIDAHFGFEMETFEFLNILKVHGFPKVIGVLTHLDKFKKMAQVKEAKKTLKHRFWTEICDGAKLFYLSGLINGRYPKREILNLARFISVTKFRPLKWRNTHGYIVADRWEDVTDDVLVHENAKVDRKLCIYGYVRGTAIKPTQRIHMLGVGDFAIQAVDVLPDPCGLPDKKNIKKLGEKDKAIYAPLADVGNVLFDQDATYINLRPRQVLYSSREQLSLPEGGAEAGSDRAKRAEPKSAAGENISMPEVLESEKDLGEGQHLMKELQRNTNQMDKDIAEEPLQLLGGTEIFLGGGGGGGIAEQKDGTKVVEEEEEGNEDGGKVQTQNKERGSGILDRMYPAEDANRDGVVEKRVFFEHQVVSVNKGAGDADSSSDENPLEVTAEEDATANEIPPSSDSDNDFATFDYLHDREGEKNTAERRRSEEDGLGSIESRLARQGHQSLDLIKPTAYGKDDGQKRNATLTDVYGRDVARTIQGLGSSRREIDDGERMREEFDSGVKDLEDSGGDSDKSEDDDFFKIRTNVKKRDTDIDKLDVLEDKEEENWSDSDACENIRDLFVTGDWSDPEADDGEGLANEEEEEEEEENSGEDQQNGEMESSKGQQQTENVEEDGTLTYMERIANDMKEQAELNIEAFKDATIEEKLMHFGCASGLYVRIEVNEVPCEIVTHFKREMPLILGALLPSEHAQGMLQVRIKKHRWHRKILKTNDPLIISLGWRRFQTLPVYSTLDRNETRMRFLKYTPEHMHCIGTFYGPLTMPNIGFCAFQRAKEDTQASFRICATGVVLEQGKSFQIVKKLKLTGTPYKIHRNTAFIRGMFSSALEASKFIGASIKTVSGIRGQIKKPVTNTGSQSSRGAGPDGAFRATFEDRVKASDIVFLRTWSKVEPEKFYNPVTSLLEASTSDWQGVRPIRDIRRQDRVPIPVRKDSEYREIVRKPIKFAPMHVPSKLQASLPFATKSKIEKKRKRLSMEQRRKVVMEPEEKKAYRLVQTLNTIRNERAKKRAEAEAARKLARDKRLEKMNEKFAESKKEKRKARYASQLREKRKRTRTEEG